LGYKSHSDFVLEERIKILKKCCFLNDLLEKRNQLLKRICSINRFAKELDGIEQLKNGTVLIILRN
jgi:hypothetical protein